MGIISQHHDSAGWALVLLVAFVIATAMVLHWTRQDLKRRERRCRDVLRRPSHRLMTGAGLIFAGAVVRIGSGLPLRPMQAAEAWGWWRWWYDLSFWIADAGAVTVLAGLIVMMWPALRSAFGWSAWLVVLAGTAMVYSLGAGLTEIIKQLL